MADDPTTTPAGSTGGGRGLAAGEVFAGHEIRHEAGRGGTGIVYAATHVRLRIPRALKLLTEEAARDPTFRARFEFESQIAARLDHPSIVPVHEAGESEGRLYLSMRFVDGPSLAQVLAREGRLSLTRTTRLVTQLASALDAAHADGLVHRDVKPANVLLEGGADAERAFLTDFGISRLLIGARPLTETGQMVGTVDYVAPEQIAGEAVDATADVYALACVAYECLAGEPPFRRATHLATMFAHANDPRPRPSAASPGLPRGVDAVLQRALAVDPRARYPSAGEFAGELARAAAGARIPKRRTRPRAGRTLALAGLAGLALGAAALIVVSSGDDADPPPAALSAPTASVVGTAEVVPAPTSVAVGQLNVWVASESERAIAAIVPPTSAAARPAIAVEGRPVAIAPAFSSVWVVDRERDSLVRLDPDEGGQPVRIPVGRAPADLALSANHLWVANEGDETVSRVDPVTNRVDATFEVGSRPTAIAIGEGGAWVANAGDGDIVELDPVTGERRGAPIEVGGAVTELAAGEAGVWAIDTERGRLVRINPGSRALSDPIELGAAPRAVTTGFGYAWVALADDTVQRIDPTELLPAGEPIPVGGDPSAVAVGQGFVWTANRADDSVTRVDPRSQPEP